MTQPVSYQQGPLESHSKLAIFSALLGQHAEWRKILFLLSILNLQSCFTRSMLRYTLDYMNRRVNLKKKNGNSGLIPKVARRMKNIKYKT